MCKYLFHESMYSFYVMKQDEHCFWRCCNDNFFEIDYPIIAWYVDYAIMLRWL